MRPSLALGPRFRGDDGTGSAPSGEPARPEVLSTNEASYPSSPRKRGPRGKRSIIRAYRCADLQECIRRSPRGPRFRGDDGRGFGSPVRRLQHAQRGRLAGGPADCVAAGEVLLLGIGAAVEQELYRLALV